LVRSRFDHIYAQPGSVRLAVCDRDKLIRRLFETPGAHGHFVINATLNREMSDMRNLWLAVAVTLTVAMAGAPAAHADTNSGLTGKWARDDGTTRIAISPCGADLCAVNTWVKDPAGSEKVGDKLILTLKPVSSSVLQGQAFDVRRQAHYKVTITLTGGKAMRISGCVLLGIICKDASWTRTG
jgi:uncharacterized protein (DUF2147 family)